MICYTMGLEHLLLIDFIVSRSNVVRSLSKFPKTGLYLIGICDLCGRHCHGSGVGMLDGTESVVIVNAIVGGIRQTGDRNKVVE